MKIVINTRHSGFSLSNEATQWLKDRGHPLVQEWTPSSYNGNYHFAPAKLRSDPSLIAAVETLGRRSWGYLAELSIVEIPPNVEWTLEEYDGREWIAEKHRTWG